jgi:hypothetical protein
MIVVAARAEVPLAPKYLEDKITSVTQSVNGQSSGHRGYASAKAHAGGVESALGSPDLESILDQAWA